MWYTVAGIVLVVLVCYILYKRVTRDSFEVQEAKRYLVGFNEVDENWSSNGRVYTNGIALIEDKKTGEKRFIKQAELCDIGILS
jgi:hypothetical protein